MSTLTATPTTPTISASPAATPTNQRLNLITLGAWIGIASAVVLTFNGLKRGGILADGTALQLIAPFGAALAIALLIAVWARGGQKGSWSLLLVTFGLALTVGGEFILNFVFPYLTPEARSAVLAGPATTALAMSAVVFLLGVIAFTATQWNASPNLRLALVVMVLGAVPIALRSALPPIAVPIGVWLLALAQIWIAITLLRNPTDPPRS